ncbi:MAG TPA: phosphate ABC transporter permease PstA [Spirochaetales bacterium]|nr:phosphate ABC transporter permease PstA [Spirochaetales bacterium]
MSAAKSRAATDARGDGSFLPNLGKRQAYGRRWAAAFAAATIAAVLVLGALVASIVNDAFGLVAMEYTVDPATLAPGGDIEKLSDAELVAALEGNLKSRRLRALGNEKPLAERERADLLALVEDEVIGWEVVETFSLAESLLGRAKVDAFMAAEHPEAKLVFRSWVNARFLGSSQSATAIDAGVRSALIGTLMTILITLATAFPIGIAAAIWLEEYAKDNRWNRFIRVNIYNLAGVPSIIYGMLGLAIFVRALEPITSGAAFGAVADPTGANGRTILSAGLTLALLVLPVIIINAQEAFRAVPRTLRESGYAVGATKWQVVWHHVLPASFDRVLTGAIVAVSRAIGETAPLVVVGASTFLTQDPTSVFSKFTTLPIQIYQWTARPQEDFHNIAAAAILVLLVLMLSLNAFAIILRNRLRAKKRFA